MKPRKGEKPPLSSNSTSHTWRAVRSHEGHSFEWPFSSAARPYSDEIDQFPAVRGNKMAGSQIREPPGFLYFWIVPAPSPAKKTCSQFIPPLRCPVAGAALAVSPYQYKKR